MKLANGIEVEEEEAQFIESFLAVLPPTTKNRILYLLGKRNEAPPIPFESIFVNPSQSEGNKDFVILWLMGIEGIQLKHEEQVGEFISKCMKRHLVKLRDFRFSNVRDEQSRNKDLLKHCVRHKTEEKLSIVSIRTARRLQLTSCIPTLAYVALEKKKHHALEAQKALQDILPHLTEQNFGTFSVETILQLCLLLKETHIEGMKAFRLYLSKPTPGVKEGQEDFAVCLLEAFQKIGDRNAISTIKHLLQSPSSPKIHHVARVTLERLEAKIRQLEQINMLLRPADGEGIELLRPAGYVNTEGSDQLVRPVMELEDEEIEIKNVH